MYLRLPYFVVKKDKKTKEVTKIASNQKKKVKFVFELLSTLSSDKFDHHETLNIKERQVKYK